jgi:rhodanese-related sulfurtransferase
MKTIVSLTLLFGLVSTSLVSAQETKPAGSHGEKPPLPKRVKNVGVAEFEALVAAKTNQVLDVRTKREFDAGHIAGAINIDLNSPDFEKKVAELDKSKTYLVHCAGGVRSAQACVKLDKLAFTNLVNLEPGLRAWEKAGKPVEKTK